LPVSATIRTAPSRNSASNFRLLPAMTLNFPCSQGLYAMRGRSEAYARAMTTSVPPVKDEEQVDRQVAARLERQELFRRKPPIAFTFIVEQALIERGTGGVEVTRELISHLLEQATQFNIELQIMPLRQPDHAGFDGPMRLLEALDNRWLGYSEGQRGGMLVSDRKEVSIMLQRYARMRSQALTPEDSRSLLKRMQGAL